MAKAPKLVSLSGPTFGVAIAAFVSAVTAVAVSPYTPIAASTQDALNEASDTLIAAAASLSGGATADPADLQKAIDAAVQTVFETHRSALIEAVAEKLRPELEEGFSDLKSSLPSAVESQMETLRSTLADQVKAEVAAQIPATPPTPPAGA